MPEDNVIILLSTFPGEDIARSTIHTLLSEQLIACGNLLPSMESIYKWEGKVETTREVLVILKTTGARVLDTQNRLTELHPYEVPEILQIPISAGWPPYLEWIQKSVS